MSKPQLEHVAVDRCVALKRNPQYLSPKQLDGLKISIERDGFLAPVLVRPIPDSDDFEVLSGNHRVMAARELGMAEVPALVVHVDDQQAGRIAVNLNTIHGDPTVELLAPFLAELDDSVLATVHLEDEMLAELKRFDETLAATLSQLEVPESLDTETPADGSITQCVCPDCGRRHMKLLRDG